MKKTMIERAWHNINEVNDSIVDDDLLDLIRVASKVIKKNGHYFKYAIQSFCNDLGVEMVKNKKNRAVLIYKVQDYGEFIVRINRKKTFLSFSIRSKYTYNTLDEIPKKLLNKIMLENTISRMGFWSLKKVKVGFVFQRMFNEELNVLSSESLATILDYMVKNCISIAKLIQDQTTLQKLISETEDEITNQI